MRNRKSVWVAAFLTALLPLACDKNAPSEKPSATNTKQSSSGHSPADNSHAEGTHGDSGKTPPTDPHTGMKAMAHGQPQGTTVEGNLLKLDGLTLTVPSGWNQGEIAPGPFAPVAVLEIAKAGDDAENGQVRITHCPNMKGMDDMNLNRWLGQVSKPDGSSYSLDDANLSVTESRNIRVKMIDLTGNVKATMRDTPHANSRMIAAIVDHPKGPHFIVASGGAATIDQAVTAIKGFVESARAE